MSFEQIKNIQLLSLKNLLQTDALSTTVIFRNDYFVIKTFFSPEIIDANYIAFLQPPNLNDFSRWQKIFKEEFVGSKVHHIAYTWDSELIGDIAPFLQNGFKNHQYNFYEITETSNNEYEFTYIDNDQSWNELNILSQNWTKEAEKVIKRFRRCCSEKIGYWYIIRKNKKIIGDIGIIKDAINGNSVFHIHGEFPIRILQSFKKFSNEKLFIECSEQSALGKDLSLNGVQIRGKRNFLYQIND